MDVKGGLQRAGWVIAAGICAALHVAKLPPAIPALQAALGVSLVQAGFLLSAVQLCGMAAGVAFGAAVDGLGHRRGLLGGLLLLALASALGGLAGGAAPLLALRAVEGCGFLLVVLSAPALLRQVVPPDRLPGVLGVWGAYVPLATAGAFFLGPLVVGAMGWRSWWWGVAVLTLAVAWRVATVLPKPAAAQAPASPAPPRPEPDAEISGSACGNWRRRLAATLASPGPWMVALAFGCYSSQWLAVVGFLPTIYAANGWSAGAVAAASGCVAGANALGNIAAGRWLARGVAPFTLLALGFGAMGTMALLSFAEVLPPAARLGAALLFSLFGGLVPATLFNAAVRVAPSPQAVGTTLGWVQQLSATGQFAGPPLVAWVATAAGGWHRTGWVTATLALLGLVLAARLALRLGAGPAGARGAVSPSPPPR